MASSAADVTRPRPATARAVGNRIGARRIAAFADDGANEQANYADTTGWTSVSTAGGRSAGHGVRRSVGVPAAQPRRGGDPEHRPAGGRAGLHRHQLARGHAVRARTGAAPPIRGPPPRWDREMQAWVTQVLRHRRARSRRQRDDRPGATAPTRSAPTAAPATR
jgi:hypothetical protein